MEKRIIPSDISDIHLAIRRHRGTDVTEQTHFHVDTATDSGDFAWRSGADGHWACYYEISAVSGEGLSVKVLFRLLAGQETESSVGTSITISDWTRTDYLLMPGAVYQANRFRCLPVAYPPLFTDPADHRVDLPITVTDIPRFGVEADHSKIEQTTGDLATPAVGIHQNAPQRNVWILIKQANRMGNLGITAEENLSKKTLVISLSSPSMRQRRQTMCTSVASDDRAATWRAGDELELEFQVYSSQQGSLQGLFSEFAQIRKRLTGANPIEHELPFSAAWRILNKKYDRDNWDDGRGYYSVGTRETMNFDWQLGWVGGLMATESLFLAGKEVSKRRAIQTIDTIMTKTQRPTGFFYGLGNGKVWWSDGFTGPHPSNMQMTRRAADALYFLLKQFVLFEQADGDWHVPELWATGTMRLADALVGLWQRYRQFGQFVDIETGELVVGGTPSASMAPAGLALCGHYYNKPAYLQVAEAAARSFYEEFVRQGLTVAGPGEILQAPDSESAFGLLESFVVLYEITGKSYWLKAAEEMAEQCATWCVSYDYQFPPSSQFGRLGIHSAGAVLANAQNKHAAPGICTLSGDSLLRLYRATGRLFFLELLRDIAHNLTQYISRNDKPISDMPSGWMNERVNLSDWEGQDMVGNVLPTSTWPEVSCMLTWVEVPGLYVNPKTGFAYALDHVDVEILSHHHQQLQVRLRNPTGFYAAVRAFIESGQPPQVKGIGSHMNNMITIEMKPGQSRTLTITTDEPAKMTVSD